jgi:hypothetical protein
LELPRRSAHLCQRRGSFLLRANLLEKRWKPVKTFLKEFCLGQKAYRLPLLPCAPNATALPHREKDTLEHVQAWRRSGEHGMSVGVRQARATPERAGDPRSDLRSNGVGGSNARAGRVASFLRVDGQPRCGRSRTLRGAIADSIESLILISLPNNF